ncbi:hypothetical protein MD484_g8673, partial [Candolleomyces efflorescens]
MNAVVFPNASRCNFERLQININQNARSPLDQDPLEILHMHRALEALHTSKTAASAPKCKPGTRTKAIADLTNWARELLTDHDIWSSGKSVLWFRGPAGAGKTCIMREVARICRQDGLLAGDYFFSTRVPGLDDEAHFVATIVCHLIKVVPALVQPVQNTIRLNPAIFEQSLEFQMEELLSKHAPSIPLAQAPRIFVIDGFDECRDLNQRARLLHLIQSLVTPPLSFRVVLASRPEFDIRTAFNRPPLSPITTIVHLENYEASEEIHQYLSEEFARLRETHPAKQSIPSDWPGQSTLHALTVKSSGGYIYPSVVIKYIDNPRRHLAESLKHVLDASSTTSSEGPLAELDALYNTILNPPDTDIPLVKRLLHTVIEITRFPSEDLYWGHYLKDLTQKVLLAPNLDTFLCLAEGTTEMTLCDLHSVLSVTEDVERPFICFLHKSLEDYLCSPERGGNFYQSQAVTHSDILSVSIQNLEVWNRKLIDANANFQVIPYALRYSCEIWKILLIEKKCYLPSIQDFDLRIAWRCSAFAYVLSPLENEFNDLAGGYHDAIVGWITSSRR